MNWIFWCSLGFLAYSFAGYPAMLWILGLGRRGSLQRASIWLRVSFIIACHNAAEIIGEKLDNTMQLDYPIDKLEVIVASDASNDGTNDVVRAFAGRGVRLIEITERRGTHYAQMVARDASKGEILVFTDAGVVLEPLSLRKMVENFADASVGVVSSEDVVPARAHNSGEASYVQAEMGLRHLESRLNSTVSASGSFFGARRKLCDDWHTELSSDFFVPLHAVGRGFRVIVDPECRAGHGLVRNQGAEFRRKIRTVVLGLDVFFSHLVLLNPFRYGLFSWELASHKLFRWLVPFALAALLLSNVYMLGAHPVYRIVLVLQLLGYVMGLLALALEDSVGFKPFKLAGFFLMSNIATGVAWVKFLFGEKYVVWEPTRRV